MFADDSDTYLVFVASMYSDYDEDKDRVFMVQYYLSNKTIAIFEKKDLKRGINGGRFLARMALVDPRTGENYDDDAFYVGAKIQAAGRIFELLDAPEYTLCQMEAHSDRFKEADLQIAVEKLSDYVKSAGINLSSEFSARDSAGPGTVSEGEARTLLFSYTPDISKQVALTVLRRFVKNGRFEYQDLLHYL